MTTSVPALPRTRDAGASRPRAIVAVLCAAGICVALVQTMIIPLVPSLPGLLEVSPTRASWVISSTLIAAAVVTPVSGRLGDMFGKRRLLLVSLALIVLGSLVCALSSSLAPMLVGRVLQGLAMGTIPLGISIMRDELPAARMPAAIALMSATLGIGGSIGMPASAWMLAATSWRMMFLAMAAIGAICLVAVVAVVPRSALTFPGRFDLPGAAGLSAVLVAFLLVITQGAGWGWSSPLSLGLVAGTVVGALAWGWFETRTSEPLVDLRVSARPTVLWTNLSAVFFGFAMYTQGLAFPQMMNAPVESGYGHGLSMVEAGWLMAPGGVAMMVLSPASARLTRVRGPRTTLVVAGVLVTLGYALPLLWSAHAWQLTIASIVMCAGLAFGYGAMPMLIMSAVPLSETAAANGVNALVRSLGLAASAAVTAAVLAGSTVTSGAQTYPTLGSFRASYALALVAAVAAILCALRVPARRDEALDLTA